MVNPTVSYERTSQLDGRTRLAWTMAPELWSEICAALINAPEPCRELSILIRTRRTGELWLPPAGATPAAAVYAYSHEPRHRTARFAIAWVGDGRMRWLLDAPTDAVDAIVAALGAHGDACCAELADLLRASARGERVLPLHAVPMAGDHMPGT